jgi:LAO/AO transport system kinase
MTKLSVSPSAFIRSSAAGTVLGGMGRRSHEMMTLLAAAGYDTIFAETVGVGQSEHTAWQFTDGFILVLQPGAGDELQGIKRGITELADILIINKADGPQRELARIARNQYENAMHYFSSLHSLWTPKVLTCSATEGEGIDQIWDILRLYHTIKLEDPFREEEKERKKKFWLTWSLGLSAHELLMNHPIIKSKIETAYVALHQKNASLFKTEFDIEQIMKSILQLTGPEKEN